MSRHYSKKFKRDAVRISVKLEEEGLNMRIVAERLNIKYGTLLHWRFKILHHGIPRKI